MSVWRVLDSRDCDVEVSGLVVALSKDLSIINVPIVVVGKNHTCAVTKRDVAT